MERRNQVLLLVLGGAALLNGCADLGVIGKAAMRELAADAINVEQASFTEANKKAGEVKVAAAEPVQQPAPKGKKDQKKGMWEHN